MACDDTGDTGGSDTGGEVPPDTGTADTGASDTGADTGTDTGTSDTGSTTDTSTAG